MAAPQTCARAAPTMPLTPSHPCLSPLAQGSSVNSSGEMLKMSAPLEHLNLHVREGAILPTQVSAHPSPPWGQSTACTSPPPPQASGPPPWLLATLQHLCL